MRVIPFEPHHLALLSAQPAQAFLAAEMVKPEYGAALLSAGPARTAFHGTEVIACAGLIHQWPNRSIAWAILSRLAGRHMLGLTREIGGFLRHHPIRRVETGVSCDFPAAERWAEMLGFEREGMMRAYTPEGADCYLYARIR